METTENSISGGEFHNVVVQSRTTYVQAHAPRRPVARMSLPTARHYVNNAELFARMDAIWRERSAEGVPTRILLTGPPGIGTTAAASRWLQLHQADLPGPQFVASFVGAGSTIAVLESWLAHLGVPKEDRPSDVDALAANFRSCTSSGPVVVLIDNAATAAQVIPLLPGSDASIVLITSHSRLSGLVSRFDVDVEPVRTLDYEHSDDLLARVGRLTDDTRTARRPMVRACGGVPLAVRIVGAQLAGRGAGALSELAARLADRRTRLEAMKMPDDMSMPGVPGMLDLVYQGLEPEVARAYRLLGLHPTTVLDEGAIQALTGTTGPVQGTLHALHAANFLDQLDDGTFSLNSVVHDHAWQTARRDEPREEREAALDRIVRYYTDCAERTESALSGRWRYDPLGGYRQYAHLPLTDRASAIQDIDRQRPNLVAAVELAHRTGRHPDAWRICQGLWTACLRGGHHSDWIRALSTGVAAALETGDLLALARMHFERGFAHLDRFSSAEGDAALAREHLDEALRLSRTPASAPSEGRRRTESSALEGLALLELRLGRAVFAMELLNQAMAALETVDHPRGRALLSYHRGRALTALADHEAAEHELLSCRTQFAALSDGYNEARALTRLAEGRRAAGRPARAVDALTEAAELMTIHGPAYQQAEILLLRGDLHRDLGEAELAAADWTRARTLYAAAHSTRTAEAELRLAGAGSDSERGDEE